MKHNTAKSNIFTLKGCCDMWNMRVQVSDLKVTKPILDKSGYTDQILTMQNLVYWESLKSIPSFSRGPKAQLIRYKMSWLALLKIMLELILVGIIGPTGPNDHVDPTLLDLMQGKRKSSDEFVKPIKKKKLAQQKTQSFAILPPSVVGKWPSPNPPSWMQHSGYYPVTPPVQAAEPLRDSSPQASPEPFGSPVQVPEPIRNPILVMNREKASPKTKTPVRATKELPVKPFLNETIELEKTNRHTSLYKGKAVQIIGLNRVGRNGLINVRISDTEYWIDCNCDNKLRIWFVGEQIRVNDVIQIDATTGSLSSKDFTIVNLRKPGKLQIPGLGRIGEPMPLYADNVSITRGYKMLNIKPIVIEEDLFDEEHEEVNDEELLLAISQPNPKEIENTANLDETYTLEELLDMSCPPKRPSVADTPLAESHIAEIELRANSISRTVFENARQLFMDRRYDEDDVKPKISGNKIKFVVESEFNIGEYSVIIEWPQMQPRTEKGFCKTFVLTCSCDAFADHGPKYCKHISFVVMKYLNYG